MCKSQHIVPEMCTKPAFDATYIPPTNNPGIHPDIVIDCADELLAMGKCVGLVSVMHANNETGLENLGLSKIAQECHTRNILFHTDCAQAVGCSDLNVEKVRCGFMLLSSHKIHGGKGAGALYIRDKSKVSPLIFGAAHRNTDCVVAPKMLRGVGFGKACEILKLEQERIETTLQNC